MSTKPYAVFRGDFFIKEKGTSENLTACGNAQDAELSMSIDSITLESSGNERGTLDKEETKRTATLSVTFNKVGADMLKRYFYSKSSTAQSAGTDKAFTLPAMQPGDLFVFPDVGVSNVEVTGKTEGVDYKLLPNGGGLVAILAIAADVAGTYDCSAGTNIGVFTGEGTEYELYYISETTGTRIQFLRWKPDPAQAVKLIDNSNFASFQLSGELLIDESVAPGPLGRFAIVKKAG